MELWVRTADRRNLLKPTNIGLGWNCSMWGVYDGNQVLGEYKTEERCLEIIDEIQKLLLSANPKEAFMLLKNIGNDDYEGLRKKMQRARNDNFLPYCSWVGENASIEVIQPSVLVYEMPKE